MKKHKYIGVRQAAPLLQIFALLLPLAACDAPNAVSPNIQSASSALTEDPSTIGNAATASASSASNEEVVFGDDSPTPTIDIAWENGDTDKNTLNTDTLTLKVTNHLDIPAKVTVSVHTAGILEETADLNLGPFSVDVKGEILVTVSNDELPMQTTRGVIQAYATVEAAYNDGVNDTVSRNGSAPLYYKQLSNYKSMLVFGEKIFMNEHKGRFTDLTDVVRANGLENAKNTSLGRIKRNGKDFEEVTINSSIAAGNGENQPVIVGTGFGSVGSWAEEEEEMRHGK
jgi:hypothetical protein